MDMWDLRKWRRMLRYNQIEAAERLGVNRSTIHHWENEHTPVPQAVDLACKELTRRWKQRPEFGPVALVYADKPIWPAPDEPMRTVVVSCELYPNNEVALTRAGELSETPSFNNPLIVEKDGGVVWNSPELLFECKMPRRRRIKEKV